MMKRLISVSVLVMLALNVTAYAFEPYAASANAYRNAFLERLISILCTQVDICAREDG